MDQPKSDKDRRTEQLHVRVTATDKAIFAAAAHRSNFGGDISAWARVTLLTAASALGVTAAEVEATVAAESSAAVKKKKGAKAKPETAKKKGAKAKSPRAPTAKKTARPKR
jgi:hypothetical protein